MAHPSVLRLLESTHRYPLEGDRLPVLLGGTLALTVTLALLPEGLLAIPALLLMLVVFGCHARYLFDVMETTAAGTSDRPRWPDPRDIVETCVEPFLHASIVVGASFAPAILAFGIVGPASFLSWLLLGLGVAYFPAAISSFALTADFASLSPIRIAGCIRQVPASFLGMSALLIPLMAISVPARLLGEAAPVLGAFALSALWMYASMLFAHMLGVIHRDHGTPRSELFDDESAIG